MQTIGVWRWLEGLLMAYSVEKLGSFANSINFGNLSVCNSLFLLRHVSAGTSENRRKGVFQQNRPKAAIGDIKSWCSASCRQAAIRQL